MQPAKFLVELRRILPPKESASVVAALRNDPLAWNAIQEPAFLRLLLTRVGENQADWSIASLGLLAAEIEQSPAELAAEPLIGLDSDLQKSTLSLLEETLRTSRPPKNLADAALLALALRERRRRTGSWKGLLNELSPKPGVSIARTINTWQTVLSCLYSLTSDPADLLQALQPKQNVHPAVDWITHILFSNPMPFSTRLQVLAEFLMKLPTGQQVEWLKMLSQSGKEDFSRQLAKMLLETNQPVFVIEEDIPLSSVDWAFLQDRSASLQQAAAIYQFAGTQERARSLLNKASDIASYWLAGLQIQSAGMEENSSIADSYETVMKFIPNQQRLETDFALITAKSGEPVHEVIQKSSVPLARILSARQMYQAGDQASAREVARQAISDWIESYSSDYEPALSQFVLDWSPVQLMDIFTEMGLYSEAAHLGERFLTQRKDDLKLLVKLSQAYAAFGRNERAVNYAHEALLLDPENPERYRQLAILWEGLGDWSRAQAEWHTTLDLTSQSSIEDLLSFANTSLRAGQAGEAKSVCERILTTQPEHGLALTYLGRAEAAIGDANRAVDLLNRATLLAAETPLSWVSLAEVYEQRQEPERALETLHAAVAANPDSAELHFTLGEYSLRHELDSEALPHLRQAARISPESIPVTVSLVQTLLDLGHTEEALELVKRARQRWELNPGLAFLHGKIMIEQGEREKGLQVLEIALRSEQPDVEPALLYSETLLNVYREYVQKSLEEQDHSLLNQALRVLQDLLDQIPDNYQAKLLMAEGLLLKGNYQSAFERYSQMLEVSGPDAAVYHWRVEAGMGEAALRTGQLDTAMAAFQSALQHHADSTHILHLLTEAYQAGQLLEEAFESAERALQSASDDIANLSWYAKVMISLSHLPQAEEALKRAVNLDVDRADLMVRLADVQIQSGNLEEAREVLFGISHMATASPVELRRAAYLFLDLKDEESALDCLKRALQDNGEGQVALLYEIAGLYRQMNRPTEALDAIQQAIAKQPDGVHLYLAQADLLSALGRSQAALASLEFVLQTQQALAEAQAKEGLRKAVASKLVPMAWQGNAIDSMDVHVRLALLLKRVGNLPEAFEHAGKAIEFIPDNLTLRFLAADIAYAMLRYGQAIELSQIPDLKPETIDSQVSTLGSGCPAEQAAAMYGLKAELSLETGDITQARCWVEKGLEFSAENLRLRAAQVRLYEQEGDVQAASRLYDSLAYDLSTLQEEKLLEECGPLGNKYMLDPKQGTWAAEAAFAARKWQQALDQFQMLAAVSPEEPRAALALTRSIVRLAEAQRLCEDLECQAHAPGMGVGSEEIKDLFRRSIQELSRLWDPEQVARWQAREGAALQANEETIAKFRPVTLRADDAAALIAASRRANLPIDLLAYKNLFPGSTLVLAQIALTGLVHNNIEEYFLAQAVVEKEARNPLWHCLYARSAEASGEIRFALESMEIALNLWPEEPRWHGRAARLAESLGEMDQAVQHWEKALELSGEDLTLAFELGQAYLASGESSKAIQMLQIVCDKRPDHFEAWNALSEAYLQNSQLEEALESVRKATNLNSDSALPLIQAGKIYLAMGDPMEALDMARQAKGRAENPEASVLLESQALASMEDEIGAIKTLEEALVNLPQSEMLHLEHVRRVLHRDGSAKVKPLLIDLSKLFPANAEIFALLAKAQLETNDLIGSDQSASTSLRLNSDQPDMHLLLGYIDRKAGHLDQALHHFTQAAQLSPDDVEAYIELGKTHEMRREPTEAVYVYQQAMAVSPNDHRPYYLAALTMRDGKDYQNAEDMLRKAAELAPNDLNIRRQLGAVIALNLVHHSQEANSCL